MAKPPVSGPTRLSRAELAAAAGVSEDQVDRLVEAGILVERETPEGPFRGLDVLKVRLARECEESGIPLAAMATAIKEGRLSGLPGHRRVEVRRSGPGVLCQPADSGVLRPDVRRPARGHDLGGVRLERVVK